jgi:choline dehydrogenase-like flavoprotein
MTRRILFSGQRAVGGETFVAEGEELILSAGTIGSPHLLMLSGVGPASQLHSFGIPVVHDAPGVGQSLRDHPGGHVRWHVKPAFPLPPDEVGPQKVALRYSARGSSLRNDMIMAMRFWGVQRLAVMRVGLYMAMGAGELPLQSPAPMLQPCLHYYYL